MAVLIQRTTGTGEARAGVALRLLNIVTVQPRMQLLQAKGVRRTIQVNIAAHTAQTRAGLTRRQHVMRRHQNRDALARQLTVQASQSGLSRRVHARKRLIQQQQGGVRRQSARQKNPLTLTTGKLRNGSILQVQNIGAFHRRKNLNPILLRRAAEEPNLTHATGHHRVLNGQRKIPLELVLLRHITNMRTRHTRRLTQHPNLTGRRANQTQNGAQ